MRKPHYLVLALIWTICVTVFSLAKIEGFDAPINIANKDKIVHFVFYFLFYILWFLHFKSDVRRPHLYWIVFFVSIAYGALMEALQGSMGTNRSPDLADVYANSFGAFCALLVSIYFLSKKRQI